MADVEVWGVSMAGGAVSTLTVRFKGTAPRTIDRETALAWLAGGHSLTVHTGPVHHGHRGASVERVEIGDAYYIRTDTRLEAADHVDIGHAAH